MWACGGGGSGSTPTDPDPKPNPVASVTIAPTTVSIEVNQTRQLSATLRDASGSTLTGRTVTWTSSNQAVATVSTTGMVTGTGAGETTITATSEGKNGTVPVTVTQALGEGVVAAGTIGPDGGTLGTDDVGVTIPAGALSSSTQIEILTYDDPIEEFGTGVATGGFRLKGFPADRDVEVRVRLRTTAPLVDESYIALGVPTIDESNDAQEADVGFVMHEATDSAGFLVATVPVRAVSPDAIPGGVGPAMAAAGVDSLLNGLLGGVTGAKTDTVPGGKWVIKSWGKPRAELQPMVSKAVQYLTKSWTTIQGMGYTIDHRTDWPMEVKIYPESEGEYGAFVRKLPYPLDINTSWFELYTWAFSQHDMPGTAIHEFFHFVQARYQTGLTRAQAGGYKWVNEAGSTWMEEKHPDMVAGFTNTFFQGQRNDLFVGIYPSLTASDGYGKSALMKYVADRWGNATVRAMFESIKAGKAAIPAVFDNIPEPPETWWPALLTKYMKGEIYSLEADKLPPSRTAMTLYAGALTQNQGNTLRPLGAEFFRFTPDPAKFGTGTKLTFRPQNGAKPLGIQLLPFRKDESGKWEEQGGVADSLVIEGTDLKLGREYGIFLIHTKPTAPYTQAWSAKLNWDLGYTDGDWVTKDVTVQDNSITYSRTSQKDTTTIDVASTATQVFSSLAGGGVWKRSENDKNRYVWAPTPEFTEQLTGFKVTMSSEVEFYALDTLLLKAAIDIDPPASPVSGSGNSAALAGVAILLIAGLVMRRRRPVAAAVTAAACGLAFWGCEITFIDYSAKYRYEFKVADPSLTASAEDNTVPLVQMGSGSGTFFVDRYRTEYWEHIKDEEGNVVDSVAVVTTASGQATLELKADLYQDGALDDDDDGVGPLLSRFQGVSPAEIRKTLEGVIGG
jgi:hypothetical protein